jgi:hypothetical protein
MRSRVDAHSLLYRKETAEVLTGGGEKGGAIMVCTVAGWSLSLQGGGSNSLDTRRPTTVSEVVEWYFMAMPAKMYCQAFGHEARCSCILFLEWCS